MLVVLAAAVYRIAATLYDRDTGAVAAAFMLSSPFLTALAREPLLDLTLTALVAIAVAHVLSPTFLQTRASIMGAIAIWSAGLMTKWVFPVFVAGPVVVCLLHRCRDEATVRRRGFDGLLAASLGTALVSGLWYEPNFARLEAGARVSAAMGAAEGDPAGLSLESFSLYPQLVFETYASLPMRLLLLVGAGAGVRAWLRWRKATGRPERRAVRRLLIFFASWTVPPYVVFTLLSNKDSRYLAPLIPAGAALAAWAWRALPGRGLQSSVLVTLAVYTVAGQGLGLLNPRLREVVSEQSLVHSAGLARPLAIDLQGWSSTIADGWPTDEIAATIRGGLTNISPSASVAVLPDFPYINPASISWAAQRAGFRVDALHPTRPASEGYSEWEYVLLKADGEQGTPHATQHSASIAAEVLRQPALFMFIKDFDSPVGRFSLWRTWHSVPPPTLYPRGGTIDLADPSTYWHLGEGWSFSEFWGRWAVGNRATLRVQLPPRPGHRLQIDMCPPKELVGIQVVSLRYRGRLLGSFLLGNQPWAWRRWEVVVPEYLATSAIDVLELTFSHTLHDPAADERPLAVAVRSVVFVAGIH